MADTARGPWEGMTIAGGRYQQLTTLGEGGMGYVYRALDAHLQTPVVIKSPRRALLEDANQVSRFEREVGAMIRLSYPHIVPVIDIGRHDDVPFAVMRYMAGGNLDGRIKTDAAGRQLPMPPESLKIWLPSIAQALDFVHQQNYLHRDVKPPNILFDTHGHAYLSDFGIIKALGEQVDTHSSKLTREGFLVGTVDYMAPELLSGQSIDGRSDQYALAVTVYQVLSGRLPFEGNTAAAIMVQQVSQPPRPLSAIVASVPPRVCSAVLRGLAKAPQQRFSTCHEFAQAVMQGAAMGDMASDPRPAVVQESAVSAVRRATAVEPIAQFTPEHRATALMPVHAHAAIPASGSRATNQRQVWLVGSVLLVIALVGLGAAFLIPASADNDSQYEVLEQDPLPRLIVQWNNRANRVEDSLVIDSRKVRVQPEYANADEFVVLLDAQEKNSSPAVGGEIAALGRDLEGLRKTYAQLTEKLNRRFSGEWTKPSTEAAREREQLDLERRGLQDQESKLTAMRRRLEALTELQEDTATKKYDAAAIAEIAALREMEAASTATERPQIAGATQTRARELLNVKNEKLASLALNVLARTGDSAATRAACDRLANGQPEPQAPLCTSLLVSGNPESIAAAATFMKAHPEVAKQLNVSQLLQCVEGNLAGYEPIVEPLAALCTTGDERMRLVRVQTRAMNDSWSREIEQACASGLLASRVDEIIVDILAHDRKSAFPLAKHLLEQHPNVKLETLTADELQRAASEDRELKGQLIEQLLLRGSGPRRSAALQAYRAASLPVSEPGLRQRIEKEGVSEPAALLNGLLATDDARCLELAEFVLIHVQGIEPAKLDFHHVSAAALDCNAIRQPLARLALENPEAGRLWAIEQLLRPSFVNRFRIVEATNRHQLLEMKQITQVLNGKLIAIKGHATLSDSDRGLEVPTSDFSHLRAELDSQAFGQGGKFETSLSGLRAELKSIRESTDARFAADLNQLDEYLSGLLELTKTGRELGKVYDFTIGQQLPGARRELQKRKLDSWSFRFTRSNIETFQRELPRYESLEKTLASNRASLPAFLLKPPSAPESKVSKSEHGSP